MIILDTNVVSEMMKDDPAETVTLWYKTVDRRHLFTTAVTRAEILAGITVLPRGRKRSDLEQEARAMFAVDFAARTLSFDSAAADEYGNLIGEHKRSGANIKPLDAQIAAIVRAHGMALATRNMKDFKNCRVELINPWNA